MEICTRTPISGFPPVATMKRNCWFYAFGLFVISLGQVAQPCLAKEQSPKAASKAPAAAAGPAVDIFDAVDAGQVDAKFVALNDHEAKLIVTNNTDKPVTLKMPEAFAGVPVAAQFGGGGGGGNRGGGGRTGGTSGGGGGQQSVGGGGGMMGGGGMGGGGGMFSVPPEKTTKVDLPIVCLDHGLRDPSSSAPYKMVRAEEHLDRPAVIELLKAYGRGELKRDAVQAATWHLNNDLSWEELAAKKQGTKRSFSRPPYFSQEDIRAGMNYATEAQRLAVANSDEYRRVKKELAEKAAKAESSEARSTTDTEAKEPVKSEATDDKAEATEDKEAAKPATAEAS